MVGVLLYRPRGEGIAKDNLGVKVLQLRFFLGQIPQSICQDSFLPRSLFLFVVFLRQSGPMAEISGMSDAEFASCSLCMNVRAVILGQANNPRSHVQGALRFIEVEGFRIIEEKGGLIPAEIPRLPFEDENGLHDGEPSLGGRLGRTGWLEEGLGLNRPAGRDDEIRREPLPVSQLELGSLEPAPSLAVIDVSFISLRRVLPATVPHLAAGGRIYALIKPQFEVGRERIGKGGIVRDAQAREDAVAGVLATAEELGLDLLGSIESPITGTEGNIEYLAGWRVHED